METRRNDRSGTGHRANRSHETSRCRTLAANARTWGIATVPDFTLVREVQMRATGANIHGLSQQLQIYVSAVECGALVAAQAAEASLRSWLAVGR